jgi:bacterioferritin-associated ferredoxin
MASRATGRIATKVTKVSSRMYICNCNGLTERAIKQAIDTGVRTWTEVHAYHGCKPQCGRCAPEIAEYLSPPDDRRSSMLPPSCMARA